MTTPPEAFVAVAVADCVTLARTTVWWPVVMVAAPMRAVADPTMDAVACRLESATMPPTPPSTRARAARRTATASSPIHTPSESAFTLAPSAISASTVSATVAVPEIVVIATPIVPLPPASRALAIGLVVARTSTARPVAVILPLPPMRAVVDPATVVVASTFATATPIPAPMATASVLACETAEPVAVTRTSPPALTVLSSCASRIEPIVFCVYEVAPAATPSPPAIEKVGRFARIEAVSLALTVTPAAEVIVPSDVYATVVLITLLTAAVPAKLRPTTPPATPTPIDRALMVARVTVDVVPASRTR